MQDMSDDFLERVIRYLERHGVEAALMTPEERAEDPLADAEYRLGRMGEGHAAKYKELIAERASRKINRLNTQAVMAIERPGAPIVNDGRSSHAVTSLNDSLRRLPRR